MIFQASPRPEGREKLFFSLELFCVHLTSKIPETASLAIARQLDSCQTT